MSKGKREKWAEFSSFANTLEPYDDPIALKGNWREEYFKNDHPLFLELACGKAEYAVTLAELYPQWNYVAVDIKSDRMWKGAQRALEKGLSNIAFLRIQIEHLLDFFAEDEVQEIWLTFPDPFPKRKHRKKRLTHARFLHYYKKILSPQCQVHLKTDARSLFIYTKQQLQQEGGTIKEEIEDLYNPSKQLPAILTIKTFYEQQHLKEGRTIYYLRFRP